jgi:hypothetical protein
MHEGYNLKCMGFEIYVCRLVSPSPPPRPINRKRHSPQGVFKRQHYSLHKEHNNEQSTMTILSQPENEKSKQSKAKKNEAERKHLNFMPSPASGQLNVNQADGKTEEELEDEDREEENIDPEEFMRKTEAILKWLAEQPDPSEYIGNELQRARRQKDGKDKANTQITTLGASNNLTVQSIPEDKKKPQSSSSSKPFPLEPLCVSLARRSLLAKSLMDPSASNEEDVPEVLDVTSIPLILQAQADTVQFILEKREQSASYLTGADGDEFFEAQGVKNYNMSALFCLDLNHPVRRAAIALVEWKWLEIFMLTTTFLNCIFMSLYDPCDNSSKVSNLDKITSFIFIFIYFSEFLIKITAMGFIAGQYSYLNDNWNRLDFLIVVTGILDALPFATMSTSFTAFRLLRPLRAIRLLRSFMNTTGYLKDLDVLIRIIVASSRLLFHISLLICFIMFMFGMVGVVLFEGAGRGRCYNINNGALSKFEKGICLVHQPNSCPSMFSCLGLGNNLNIFHFDDIGHAALVVLQTLTMRGWTLTLEKTEDGSSNWAKVYFLSLLAVGPFFAARLFLVILADQYTCIEAESRQAETAALCLFEVRVGIIEAKHLPRMDTFGEADPYVEVRLGNTCKVTKVIKNTLSPEWQEYFTFAVTGLGAKLAFLMYDWNRFGSHHFMGKVSIPIGQLDEQEEGTNLWYELEEQDSASSNGAIHVIIQWKRNESDPWPNQTIAFDNGGSHPLTSKPSSYSSKLAISKVFNVLISAITTVNVIGLAIEYDCEIESDGTCVRVRFGLDLIYIFCTCIFLLENIVKLVAFGVVNYFKDSWNMFNTFIVIFGMCEIPVLAVFSWNCVGPFNAEPGCPALYPQYPLVLIKILRIARVLKLAKHMIDLSPFLKRKFDIIRTSAIAASTAIPVIVLFVLMAAILGMNLFGGLSIIDMEYQDGYSVSHSRLEVGAWIRCSLQHESISRTCRILDIDLTRPAPYRLQLYPANGIDYWAVTEASYDIHPATDKFNVSMILGLVPRGNFDSFFAATITSFQLITFCDFDQVWSTSVLGSGHSYLSAYFAIMILVGHFLVFNLFVAITLQSVAA